jgi:hypothetical protein
MFHRLASISCTSQTSSLSIDPVSAARAADEWDPMKPRRVNQENAQVDHPSFSLIDEEVQDLLVYFDCLKCIHATVESLQNSFPGAIAHPLAQGFIAQ